MKKRKYNQNQRALSIIEKFNKPIITRYRFASYICGLGQEKYPGLRKQLFLRILISSCKQDSCYKKDLRTYNIEMKNHIQKIFISKKTLRQIIKKINIEAKTEIICYSEDKPNGLRTPKRSYYISFFDYAFMGEPKIEDLRKEYITKMTQKKLEKILNKFTKFLEGNNYGEIIQTYLTEKYDKKRLSESTNKEITSDFHIKQFYADTLAIQIGIFRGYVLEGIFGKERSTQLYLAREIE